MASKLFPEAARALGAVGKRFYDRGWALGTTGNFSVVVSRQPLRLAITASSVHKGRLTAAEILVLDERGSVVGARRGVPSAEALLHVEIVKQRGAGAVLHTHSVWNTMLSDLHAAEGGFAIEGYEMLKGLEGVRTHEHRTWIPIVENDQDMTRLASIVGATLAKQAEAKALLLRRHGLYTWGATLDEAERHVEVLEFLFETIGRTRTFSAGKEAHDDDVENSRGRSNAAGRRRDSRVSGRTRNRV